MAASKSVHELGFKGGFRFHFWAKESSRCILLWAALILLVLSGLTTLWNQEGQTRDIRAVENEYIQIERKSGLYTIDDTNEFLNCTTPSIQNFPRGIFPRTPYPDGTLLINLAVVLYMFVALAIVCDDYFMPALQLICDDLHLREDVAGATFMAVGGSAPELFASIIGVFVAKGDIGIGTIVGSAVFNLLFVVGLCGLLAGKEILLTCWPLIRDCTCYVISIGALVISVADSTIYWYDATLLLLIYIGYLTVMYFNEAVEQHVTSWMNKNVKSNYKKAYELERVHLAIQQGEGVMLLKGKEEDEDDIFCERSPQSNGEPPSMQSNHSDQNNNKKREQGKSVFELPNSRLRVIPWLISLPLLAVFYITIPDSRQKSCRRCYPLTFIMSLVWIGGLTFILVWMVTVIGYKVGIHDTIMGLTLLAAGASTPDTMLSVIAAREGYGDMAISHSIGSNIFDILIGLGFPWFLQTVILNFRSKVFIYSGAILFISLLLLVNVFALILSIALLRFKLNCKLGVLLIMLYFVFLVLSLLFEMNIIIPGLSLPVCQIP